MSFKEKIKADPVVYLLALSVAAFVAGVGAASFVFNSTHISLTKHAEFSTNLGKCQNDLQSKTLALTSCKNSQTPPINQTFLMNQFEECNKERRALSKKNEIMMARNNDEKEIKMKLLNICPQL